jgi:hypothetical protein
MPMNVLVSLPSMLDSQVSGIWGAYLGMITKSALVEISDLFDWRITGVV